MKGTWLGLSAGASLSYAGSNWLSGVIGQEAADPSAAGLSNGEAQMMMTGVVGVVTLAVVAARDRDNAVVHSPEAYAAAEKSLFPVVVLLASGAAFATGNLILSLALASDFHMKAFITGVLPVSAIFLLGACRLLFGERVGTLQQVGIVIAVAGVVLMATANSSLKG